MNSGNQPHHPQHNRPSSSSSSSTSSSNIQHHPHQHQLQTPPQTASHHQPFSSSSPHHSHYHRPHTHSLNTGNSGSHISQALSSSASHPNLSAASRQTPLASASSSSAGTSKPATSIGNPPSASYSQLPLPSLQQQSHHHQPVSYSHQTSIAANPNNSNHLHSISSPVAHSNGNSNQNSSNVTQSPSAGSPTSSHTALAHHFPNHSLHHHSLFQHQPQSRQVPQPLNPFQSHPSSLAELSQIHPPGLLQHHSSTLNTGNLQNSSHRTNIENYKSSATPAYHGFIQTTEDALLIFQACVFNICPKVTRRLHERERRSISSGSVYVFDEGEAGIKRWTDGRIWSPSRILNNFLIYREIDQKRPNSNTTGAGDDPTVSNPSENRNSTNNHSRSDLDSSSTNDVTKPSRGGNAGGLGELVLVDSKPSIESSDPLYSNSKSFSHGYADHSNSQTSPPKSSVSPLDGNSNSPSSQLTLSRDQERALVGSLTSTYKFREDGLVKKTISLGGMHMISYYKVDDVLSSRLRTPSSQAELFQFNIEERFLTSSHFRVPPVWGYTPEGRIWFQPEGLQDEASTSSVPHSGSNEKPQITTPDSVISNSNSSNQFHLSNNLRGISSTSPSVTPSCPQGLLNSASASNPSSASGGTNPTSFCISSGTDLLNSGNPNPPSRPSSSTGSASSPRLSPISSEALTGISKQIPSLNNLGNSQSSTTLPRSNLGSHRITSSSTSGVHSSVSNSGPNRSILLNSGLISGSNATIRYEPYSRPNRSPPSLAPVATSVSSASSPALYSNSQNTGGSTFSPHSFFADSQSSTSSSPNQTTSSNRNLNNRSNIRPNELRSFESLNNVTYGAAGGNSQLKGGVKETDFLNQSQFSMPGLRLRSLNLLENLIKTEKNLNIKNPLSSSFIITSPGKL